MSLHWMRRTSFWYIPSTIWGVMMVLMHCCASIGITSARHQANNAVYNVIYAFIICTLAVINCIAEQPYHD
ncbi:MAG: hypothetical protein ACK5C8_00790 [Roseiflexaceae bacterium]|jgi:hypothetical protein|nr:hypothetical protein [Chloroflexaceae bacterium]MCE2853195.1 hypothetical protein [Chloroflexaceae bacterium]